MSLPVTRPRTTAVTVQVKGMVGDDERDCAQALVSAVLSRHRAAVGPARVRVTGAPGAGGSGLVQVNLSVCGAPARVQVPGDTLPLAIATAAARLDRQIKRLTTAWDPWPWPDPERRAVSGPGAGPIARRKTVRLHVGMACQAAAILDAMDYDVYLYTDADTGEDAIVYRAGPTGLALARQRTMRPPSLPRLLPLTVNPRRTPVMTADQAAAWLAEHWLPFVFYTDRDTRRGTLLYRRYDGDLGLVAPATRERDGQPRRLVVGGIG